MEYHNNKVQETGQVWRPSILHESEKHLIMTLEQSMQHEIIYLIDNY